MDAAESTWQDETRVLFRVPGPWLAHPQERSHQVTYLGLSFLNCKLRSPGTMLSSNPNSPQSYMMDQRTILQTEYDSGNNNKLSLTKDWQGVLQVQKQAERRPTWLELRKQRRQEMHHLKTQPDRALKSQGKNGILPNVMEISFWWQKCWQLILKWPLRLPYGEWIGGEQNGSRRPWKGYCKEPCKYKVHARYLPSFLSHIRAPWTPIQPTRA